MPSAQDIQQSVFPGIKKLAAISNTTGTSVAQNMVGGAGTQVPIQRVTAVVRVGVAATVGAVAIEGTIDGTNWFVLGTINVPTAAPLVSAQIFQTMVTDVRARFSTNADQTTTVDFYLGSGTF
jgi:hypothetical protein